MPMATLLAAARARRASTGATADAGPDRRTSQALADAGHRPRRRHRPAAARRHRRRSSRRWRSCWPASSPSARRSSPRRPPTIESALPDDARAGASPSASSEAADERRRAPRSGARTTRCGAPAGQPEVADRLGWLTIADRMPRRLDDLEAFARECVADGLTDAVLLGHGRLVAGARGPAPVLRRPPTAACACTSWTRPTPARCARVRGARSTSATTLFVVSSKSGGTVETLSHFAHFCDAAAATARSFVAVTDPGSSLATLAARARLPRASSSNDPDIGGRYSALSLLRPRARRADGRRRRARCSTARERRPSRPARTYDSTRATPGLWLGCALGELALRGPRQADVRRRRPADRVFGLWVEQLVAESTGKQGRGILPVADEPLGAPDVYGDDRVFVHLRNDDAPDADLDDGDRGAGARPASRSLTLSAATAPADLGRIFFFAEFATAVAGWVLGINPFDQPNVQEAKDNTKRGARRRATPRGARRRRRRAARRCSPARRRRRYVAIMGYVAADDGVRRGDRRAARARSATRTQGDDDVRLRAALPALDRPVPQGRPDDRAASCSSSHDAERRRRDPGRAVHVRARSSARRPIGDLQTLRAHGLPAERVTPRRATRPRRARPHPAIKEML